MSQAGFARKDETVKRQEYYDYTEHSNFREVSLGKLLLRVLRYWRLLLLAGVLGGILLGGMQILKIHGRKDDMNEKYAAYLQDKEVYEAAREAYQGEIDVLEQKINLRQQYIESSTLMQVDAHQTGSAMAEFTVRVPELENAELPDDAGGLAKMNNIVRAYYYYINFGDAIPAAAAEVGISEENLKELLYSYYDDVSSLFTLSVRYPDEAGAEKILTAIIDGMQSKRVEYMREMGEFDLVVVSKDVNTIVDSELATFQSQKFAEINTLQNNLYNKQKLLEGLSRPSSAQQYSRKNMLKSGIKYGVVGFAAGCIALFFLIAVIVLLRGFILSGDEIDRKFGLKNLVCFRDDPAKKPFIIDRVIDQLENGDALSDTAAGCDLLLSRIRNITSGSGRGASKNHVLLIGTCSEKKLRTLQRALSERAEKENDVLTFHALHDPAANPAVLHRMQECGSVVLVEEIGRSRYKDILNTVDIIDDTGRPIIGTVYF